MKSIKAQGLKALESLQDLDRDDLLEALALKRRNPPGAALEGLGIFFLGALVGLGFGLAFAPKAGADLRNELGDGLRRKADELTRMEAPAGASGPFRPGSSPT
jgi:hypothetical protein